MWLYRGRRDSRAMEAFQQVALAIQLRIRSLNTHSGPPWATLSHRAQITQPHLVSEVKVSILPKMDDVSSSITTMVRSSEAKILASQSDRFLFNGSNLLPAGVITR